MNDEHEMTDEHEVHGAFILLDLLEDTSMVSSQAVIGQPHKGEGCVRPHEY